MKTFSLIIILQLAYSTLFAQNVNYSSIPVNGFYHAFITVYNNNYVFERFKNENILIFVDPKDINKTRSVKFDCKERIFFNQCVFIDGKLIYAQEIKGYDNIETAHKHNFRSNIVEFNVFDLSNGKRIKIEKFKFQHPLYSIHYEIDTASKKIIVGVSDSVIRAYDYDLTQCSYEGLKIKKQQEQTDEFVEFYNKYNSGLTGKSRKVTFSGFVRSDTINLTTCSFKIKYIAHLDNKIIEDGKYIDSISIQHKTSKKEFELELQQEKKVMNFCMQELENGNLILYGKYMEVHDQTRDYGFFTTVLDNELNVLHGLKYFEITKIDMIEGNYPNEKYIGLAYSDLNNPHQSIYLKDEKVRIMTFQKIFYNYYDHIYIVRLSDEGDITINYIVNQISKKGYSTFGSRQYDIDEINGKIHFWFYDHKVNLKNAVNDDKDFSMFDKNKKNVFLVRCIYDPVTNGFSSKFTVIEKSVVPDNLILIGSALYFNPSDQTYTLMIHSQDDNNTYNKLYFFNYTN